MPRVLSLGAAGVHRRQADHAPARRRGDPAFAGRRHPLHRPAAVRRRQGGRAAGGQGRPVPHPLAAVQEPVQPTAVGQPRTAGRAGELEEVKPEHWYAALRGGESGYLRRLPPGRAVPALRRRDQPPEPPEARGRGRLQVPRLQHRHRRPARRADLQARRRRVARRGRRAGRRTRQGAGPLGPATARPPARPPPASRPARRPPWRASR